jgi:hypothetical protein
MIGKIYFERGVPVIILARWGKGGGPSHSLIQRHDGTKVVGSIPTAAPHSSVNDLRKCLAWQT